MMKPMDRRCDTGKELEMGVRALIPFLLIIGMLIVSTPTLAMSQVRFDVYGGTSFMGTTSLLIAQEGYPDTTLQDVKYDTRPLQPPPYYGLRLGRYWMTRLDNPFTRVGAEIELIHDKKYLEEANDPTGIVARFHLTDGLNFLMLNGVGRISLAHNWQATLRSGIGLVISHPSTVVRGQAYGQDGDPRGYRYSGTAGQLAVGVSRPVTSRSELFAEYKWLVSQPTVPIANGYATTPIQAHHLIVGWSWGF